ncbi:MAG: chromosomal replication initiator protein DnaA [Clostridia bacterium]|nr:chromosomal replication initiator protein DnaA [Clostridia bacterium]
MDCTKIWAELQDAIKTAVEAEVSYTVHIKPAKAVSFEDSVFTIAVPSSINRNMIEFRFKNKIESILEAYTGQKISLHIILEDEIGQFMGNNEESDETDNSESLHTHKRELSINEKYTFENFVIGSSNEYAASAAISTSENPGRIYNPLFLYGNSGLGKTHLMCAIGNKIKKEHPDYKVVYITTENFTTEFVECIKNYKMDEFRKKYRTADVLLVDDVQFLQNRDGFQEEFFHTFNDLHSMNKQIVLTSDRMPQELVKVEERLITRFSQGLTFDITVPDYDTRLAILRKKAELNNYRVGDDILQYIADRIKSNVRELEGALLKVISIGQLSHKEIDIDLTKFAIDSILPKDGIVKITPDKIMDKVSTFYNVTKEEIMGKSKVNSLVVPRQVAMYLCSKLTDMNAGMIGKTFSKDRTTVLHSVEKIERYLTSDKTMKTNIDYIIKDLQSL